jgi:hypothetical protein
LWLSLELGTYTAQTSPEQKKALAQKKKPKKASTIFFFLKKTARHAVRPPPPHPTTAASLLHASGRKQTKEIESLKKRIEREGKRRS